MSFNISFFTLHVRISAHDYFHNSEVPTIRFLKSKNCHNCCIYVYAAAYANKVSCTFTHVYAHVTYTLYELIHTDFRHSTCDHQTVLVSGTGHTPQL